MSKSIQVCEDNRYLFHAINGAGVGHVSRLGVVENSLASVSPQSNRRVFSFAATQRAAEYVFRNFQCPAVVARDYTYEDSRRRSIRVFYEFVRATHDFRPNIIICDTYWPDPTLFAWRSRGVRTVLILRALAGKFMIQRLASARKNFDQIFLPHDDDELRHLYGQESPAYTAVMALGKHRLIGPLARVAERAPLDKAVIFCLGAGGQYARASRGQYVQDYLAAFRSTAEALLELKVPAFLAIGTVLNLRRQDLGCLTPLMTPKLYQLFGPKTVVVSRAGYNTVWEALGAGSKLVLCGEYSGEEDVTSRAAYVTKEGGAVRCSLDCKDMVLAVTTALTSTTWVRSSLSERVNSGLLNLVNSLREGSGERIRDIGDAVS